LGGDEERLDSRLFSLKWTAEEIFGEGVELTHVRSNKAFVQAAVSDEGGLVVNSISGKGYGSADVILRAANSKKARLSLEISAAGEIIVPNDTAQFVSEYPVAESRADLIELFASSEAVEIWDTVELRDDVIIPKGRRLILRQSAALWVYGKRLAIDGALTVEKDAGIFAIGDQDTPSGLFLNSANSNSIEGDIVLRRATLRDTSEGGEIWGIFEKGGSLSLDTFSRYQRVTQKFQANILTPQNDTGSDLPALIAISYPPQGGDDQSYSEAVFTKQSGLTLFHINLLLSSPLTLRHNVTLCSGATLRLSADKALTLEGGSIVVVEGGSLDTDYAGLVLKGDAAVKISRGASYSVDGKSIVGESIVLQDNALLARKAGRMEITGNAAIVSPLTTGKDDEFCISGGTLTLSGTGLLLDVRGKLTCNQGGAINAAAADINVADMNVGGSFRVRGAYTIKTNGVVSRAASGIYVWEDGLFHLRAAP
jgi:hypothetical protein